MSRTITEAEDPERNTALCMRCQAREPYRVVSTIGNDIRLWLCHRCHTTLLELALGWLASGKVS